MRSEVRYQIQMLGKAVAAEVPARRVTHRRWLRLGPSNRGVTLLEVEVPVGVDPTEFPKADEDYIVVSEEAFSSLDDALTTLDERGIKTDEFDAIWKADNPF